MKHLKMWVVAGSICALFMAHAHASMVITDNIAGLTSRADLVLSGECVQADQAFSGKAIAGAAKVAGLEPRTRAEKQYQFKVSEVLVNKTSRVLKAGDTFEFTQFEGFTLSSGAVVHPSVRLPQFEKGREYVIFFAEREGRFITLGVNQGVFTVKDDEVTNPYMTSTMFRGLNMQTPAVAKAMGAAKLSLNVPPPSSMHTAQFSSMVKSLAEAPAEGGVR
jgi:hypothetical protein